MFVLTLTDDKLLKFVLILGEEERKFELCLFGEKSWAGSEPLLAYYLYRYNLNVHFLTLYFIYILHLLYSLSSRNHSRLSPMDLVSPLGMLILIYCPSFSYFS